VNVTPSSGPFEERDVLTCMADGYPEPSYTWTDADGVVVSLVRTVSLPAGEFNLTCTATGNFTTPCSASYTISGNATGKKHTYNGQKPDHFQKFVARVCDDKERRSVYQKVQMPI